MIVSLACLRNSQRPGPLTPGLFINLFRVGSAINQNGERLGFHVNVIPVKMECQRTIVIYQVNSPPLAHDVVNGRQIYIDGVTVILALISVPGFSYLCQTSLYDLAWFLVDTNCALVYLQDPSF